MKKWIYIIPSVLLSLVSCRFLIGEDDQLHFKRQPYEGSALRMDGFYYTKVDSYQGTHYHRYFLYQNGIIRDAGGTKDLKSTLWLSGNSKINWGIFLIDNNNILFERWYPSSGGPIKAYVRAGNIIDDKTFVITESYRLVDGKKTNYDRENEVYHFKEFSPKPSSANPYIK